MEIFYQLDRRGQSALISVDYHVALGLLQDDPAWGAEVMRLAGAAPWQAWICRWLNRWIPTRINSQEQSCFTAFGAAGRGLGLGFVIERSGEKGIRVGPAASPDPRQKIAIGAFLALTGLWPLLLAPLAWKLISLQNLAVSCVYLEPFCRYLRNKIELLKEKQSSSGAGHQ